MQAISLKEEFKVVARAGYVARGVIYLVVGGLALLAAFEHGGDTVNSQEAMLKILQQPFGYMLLSLLVVGLFSYSAWRFIQSVKDADQHGRSARALAIRAGLLVSSVTHALLGVWAIRVMLHMGGSGGGGADKPGWINGTPGQLFLGAVAVAVLGAALAHIHKGWKAGFEKYMYIPPPQNTWARPLCRYGLIARGIVWALIGWFLARSALQARAGDIQGMGDALNALRETAYGPWLLAIVAAGLFAFGIYSVLEAFYRRVTPA